MTLATSQMTPLHFLPREDAVSIAICKTQDYNAVFAMGEQPLGAIVLQPSLLWK